MGWMSDSKVLNERDTRIAKTLIKNKKGKTHCSIRYP